MIQQLQQFQQFLLEYNPNIILFIGIGLIFSSISFFQVVSRYFVAQPLSTRWMLKLTALAEFSLGVFLIAFSFGFRF